MPDEFDQPPEEQGHAPSKSARKRQMLALQRLGESLLELNEQQLAQVPIDNEQLLETLAECRRIRSHSARRRHLQLIGKLMRDVDPLPIEQAVARIHQPHQDATRAFHQLEALRDDVLAAGLSGVELVLQKFPAAERQHLRQLLLQHAKEQKHDRPPAASRKLFRYLRELQESQGGSDDTG